MKVACPCWTIPRVTPFLNDGRCVLCDDRTGDTKIPEELAAAWRLGGLRGVYDWSDAQARYTRLATDVWARVRDYRGEAKDRIEREDLL